MKNFAALHRVVHRPAPPPRRAAHVPPRISQMGQSLMRAPCACGGSCPRCRAEAESAAAPPPSRLAVNEPGDAYEQEVKRIADQVIGMPDPAASAAPPSPDETISARRITRGAAALQRKRTPLQRRESERPLLQRHGDGRSDTAVAPPIVHDVLRSPGQPLDAATRAFMEPRFSHDFSAVRVHTDARAAASTRAVNALAYTVGRDMVFNVGQYAPGTTAGKRLLAHELTHVVQQNHGKAIAQPDRLISHPDDTLERDADLFAGRVMGLAAGRITVSPAPSTPLIQRQMLLNPVEIAPFALCAYAFYKWTLSHYSRRPYTDKFLHCHASCKIASWCGWPPGLPTIQSLEETELAGILKEVKDYIGNHLHIGTPGDASWDDWFADNYGLLCSLQPWRSCASCCSDAPGAVVPPASAELEAEPGTEALASAEVVPSAPGEEVVAG